MSQGHNSTNPYASMGQEGHAPPPRQGMPGWAKALLIVGVIAGIGMVVCCGITGVMMYGGYQMAANAVSTDPLIIAQRTKEIADIELIEGYLPKVSVDMKVPVTKQMLAKCALYTREDVHGVLLVGQASKEMVGDNPEEIYLHLRTFIENDVHSNDMETTSTEEREFTVRGEPAKFEIARGTAKSRKNNEEETFEFVRVLGSFPGKSDEPAVLMLMEKADSFDEAATEKMIASIK